MESHTIAWKAVLALLLPAAMGLSSCATGPDPVMVAMQEENAKVTRERDRLSSDAAELRGDKSRLETEVGNLQGAVGRLTTDMDALKGQKGAAGEEYERRLTLAATELDATKAHALRIENEIARLKNEIAARDVAARDLGRENETLRGANERVRRDLTAEHARLLRDLTAENERVRRDLTAEHERVRNDLTAGADALKLEVAAISGDLNAARGKIAELERDKLGLQAALDKEIVRLTEAEDQLRKALKEEIDRGNVEITRFDNVLIVSFKENVLFAPDRAELNPRFEQPLLEVARVFDKLPEKAVRVEGHTAIAPSRWASSWDLGSARAVSVVRFLQEKGRIDATRLVAASFGEYRPVAPNDDEPNRRRNRRVEIVLINRPLYEAHGLRAAGVIR